MGPPTSISKALYTVIAIVQPPRSEDEFVSLDNRILRLKIRIGQVVIHLRSMKGHHAEAKKTRRELLDMLHLLRACKEQRELFAHEAPLPTAA